MDNMDMVDKFFIFQAQKKPSQQYRQKDLTI